ncbi:MAG: hypothetical protein ACO1NM_02085 [Sphingobium phenoxybenzoativorans]
MAAILLAAGLAMLATCRERPAPPKPVAHKPPAPPENLPNYRKALLKMQRMAHAPPDMARARRSMPGLIARAETLYLKNAGSAAACAAWDRVAANAMAQNDAALVHIWSVLADQRCGAAGLQTRYWQAAAPDAGSGSGTGNKTSDGAVKAPR